MAIPRESWLKELCFWADKFKGFNTAIAGGCLRDLDAGKPIKDVDIFIWSKNMIECEELHKFLKETGVFKTKWDRDYFGNGTSSISQEVVYVAEYKDADGTDYNLIFIDRDYTKEQFLQRLDFGLSRIAIFGDATYKIIRHPDYIEDMTNKLLRIRRCDNEKQLIRSIQRAGRLQGKYPDFTIIRPSVVELPLIETQKMENV